MARKNDGISAERSVRNGEVVGAIPAESIKLLKKKFYQKAERNLGNKSASWSGCH